ncbi:hypothetical protein J6590_049816 [Homalodisca vitripennis]|nr:hypothetical protein J6590_049816 [Homalodisca vitripennis]
MPGAFTALTDCQTTNNFEGLKSEFLLILLSDSYPVLETNSPEQIHPESMVREIREERVGLCAFSVISNLFTRDEQAEIIQELTPIMKRENPKRTLTHENVMEHFLVRTCQNLHVVFCFSPVGEKFRNRALRFPALVSGCTIDWYQPWPKDALVLVAKHFITDFEIECTLEVKNELIAALGSIQDVVSKTSLEYFQRYLMFNLYDIYKV